MSETPNPLLGGAPGPGDRVGPYLIDGPLGSGGKAAVFRARTEDGRPVAIKVLHPASIQSDEIKRFTREYRAVSRMDHPNVVRVHEAGMAVDYPWIAMELVEGCDLGELLDRWKADPPRDRFERVESILRDLCNGLAYVHELGLIHRDLKPTNVLITEGGTARITDFGVVKDASATGTQLTVAGKLVGTVAFMAPEQITGENVDARADLYALGAVLYMMLTTRRPIEASSVAGYLARHLTEVPRPPSEIDPSIPRRLEEICQRLLEKEPSRRHASARAVLHALDHGDEEPAAPMRGREPLLAALGRRLETLVDGAGGTLALVGPPGSGRTRLLSAFVDHALCLGVRIASLPDTDDPLGTLYGEGGDPVEGAALALRGGPALVAVDDLDRRPPALVEQLGRLVRRMVAMEGEPLLVLYTARSLEDRLSAFASGATSGLPSESMELGPLNRDAVVAMVRDRGLVGAAAPVLGRRLAEELDALPGAVVEQLDVLQAEDWFRREGDVLRATRSVEEFRRRPLPVPPRVRAEIEAELRGVPAPQREIAEILAVLDRPASAGLLERCSGDAYAAVRAIDTLVRAGVLQRQTEGAQEMLSFTRPAARTVLRSSLSDERRRQHHAAVAEALGARRRRAVAGEVAHHLHESGQAVAALPLFVQAARRAARAGEHAEVLELCERTAGTWAAAERELDSAELLRLRRQAAMLEGEALLARGAWHQAVAPLERAVEAARTADEEGALARCLGSLGRAHYRQGDFDRAAPILEEALRVSQPGATERAAATRALADIQLRRGDIAAGDRLWHEALDIARELGSRDGEARARRGLAHVRGLQGRLLESAELLDQAEELLEAEGDTRVRAGVLARSIELDVAAGRLGSALHRADLLVELARSREMPERLPEALALQAETLQAAGEDDRALDVALEAVLHATAHGSRAYDARLRAARVLGELDRWDEVAEALPDAESLPPSPLDDPPARYGVLRARLLAPESPQAARDLATWALVRPAPVIALRAATIVLDAARALLEAGDAERARSATKRGLRMLDMPGTDALRLEMLLLMHRCAADPRVLQAAAQIAERIARALPPQVATSFRAREPVREALRSA